MLQKLNLKSELSGRVTVMQIPNFGGGGKKTTYKKQQQAVKVHRNTTKKSTEIISMVFWAKK